MKIQTKNKIAKWHFYFLERLDLRTVFLFCVIKTGLPFSIEKRFRVLPCGHRILFVQIAIAIPSLSEAE
jgi:hypothetical protein